jgi:hypothetical protein
MEGYADVAPKIEQEQDGMKNPELKAGVSAEAWAPKTAAQEQPAADAGTINSWGAAVSARIMAHAVSGRLTADNESIRKMISSAGPMGEQLLGRLDKLEGKGWSLGSMSFNDPYLKAEAPNYLKRAARMLTMTGYHFDHYNDIPIRRIAYNNFSGVLGSLTGANYGTGDPLRHSAAIVAHELSHEDGTLYGHKDWQKLPVGEQQVLAKRLLATETRAILTQLHVGQAIGDMHLANESLRAAIKRGDLGGYIHDAWKSASDVYGSFSTINRKEASSFVNQYIDDTFGKGTIDTKTGRVNAFDVNAGVGKQVGVTSVDGQMQSQLFRNVEGAAAKGGLSERVSSGFRGGPALLKGLQIAGAYGMLSQFSDINKSFEAGGFEGTGRATRVGADWAGMELGSLAGVGATRAIFSLLPQSRVALFALPLVSIVGGVGGAHFTDKYIGESLENSIIGLKKLFN